VHGRYGKFASRVQSAATEPLKTLQVETPEYRIPEIKVTVKATGDEELDWELLPSYTLDNENKDLT